MVEFDIIDESNDNDRASEGIIQQVASKTEVGKTGVDKIEVDKEKAKGKGFIGRFFSAIKTFFKKLYKFSETVFFNQEFVPVYLGLWYVFIILYLSSDSSDHTKQILSYIMITFMSCIFWILGIRMAMKI